MEATVEETVTVALLILFLTHFHIPVIEPIQSSLFAAASDDQTALGQWITLSIWVIASILMLHSYRLLLTGFRGIFCSTAFAAFVVISTAWSQDASLTLHKAAFLILTTLFGIYFARRYPVESQMRMICIAGLLTALLSLALAAFLPRYGMDHDAHEGVLIGIFTQKNVCAREMLFLFATVLSYRPRSSYMKLCRIAAIPSILLVIIATGSKTALLITVAVCGLFALFALCARVSRGIIAAAGAVGLSLLAIAGILASSHLPWVVEMLGRDGTMTGRTEIWRAVLVSIMKHPLLGYGFSAFWLSLQGESANVILALRWAVPAAHNGFLEIWLQLGFVGLLIFLAGFLFALHAAIRGLRRGACAETTWPFAVLLLTLVYNLDESSLMQPNDFLWLLYVATLANLAAPVMKATARISSLQPLYSS